LRREPSPSSPQSGEFVASINPRKVVYNATFGMIVGDVRYAQDRVRELAEQMDGYMQEMGRDFIVVRVPAEKFDQVEGMLAELGSITKRQIRAQDVTEQYYDLQIRLKNARTLAERLRKLIKEAANMADTLAAENQLKHITNEIERLQGQLNRLTNRIAYATIRVELSRLREAPAAELAGRLPFAWLHDLGLDSLLSFEESVRID
jgi:CRP-like cAMP-binding protein